MNKHYCCTDLHGMGILWNQIKRYCDNTDTIYFLGDAIDRGPDGLTILIEMLYDKRVKFVKGNHESFMEKAIPAIIKNLPDNDDAIKIWVLNGGSPTLEALKLLSEESQIRLMKKIKTLPNCLIYTNKNKQKIFLSHAGLDPWNISTNYDKYGESFWQWDREHFYNNWNPDPKYNNVQVVHGHTSSYYIAYLLNEKALKNQEKTPYDNLSYYKKRVLKYADGHKNCLDTASTTTGCAVLFDLDKMQVEKYFEVE